MGDPTNTWLAGKWYHILGSMSDTGGGVQRLLVNGDLLDSNTAATVNTPNGGNFVIGDREVGAGRGPTGVIANLIVGTDDLDPDEEDDLYDGIIPADATDIWYMDEGVGVGVGAITSYGTDGNDGDAGANTAWQGSGGLDRVWYQPVSYIIGDTLPDRLESYQDGVIHWGSNPVGVTVTMGSLTSTTVTEAAAQELVTPDVAPEFMVPPDLFTDDPAGMRNFPLWDTFDFFADVTDTPIIWFWWVMAFALQMVVAIAVHKGFHNLLITGLAMLGMTAMGVAWGILPFWFLLTGGIAVVVAITMERSPTL